MVTKQLIGVLVLALLPGMARGQNNTNSPYTRYGYGQLSEPSSAKSKAMGGIAYGLRDNYQINSSNPASYTAVDSLTFLFEGGVTLQNTNFSDGTTKLNAKNSSFDYVAMQFRLHKKIGATLGILPFSNVGYNISQTNTGNPATAGGVIYTGDGGIHQIFVGLGVKLLKDLSIGANVSYVWGDITRTIGEYFSSSSTYAYEETTNLSIGDKKVDFGLQYYRQLGKKNALTGGVFFSPKHTWHNNTSIMTTTSAKDTVAGFGIPLSLGVGLTYEYDKRLTVGLDWSMEKWSEVPYMNDANTFCNRYRLSGGAEYFPGQKGQGYFSFIKYRLGGYYSLPYYKIGDIRAAKEYGVTGGVALPMPRTHSVLTVSAQYIRVNGQSIKTLDESYLKLNIGLTFNERWFFKRKVD
jgi:hypothetical protein